MNLQSARAGLSGGSRAAIYYSRLLASLEAQLPEEVRQEEGPTCVLSLADLDLPPKVVPLVEPNRYKVLWGGRGGTKSWGFSRLSIRRAVQAPTRILCVREYQNSIKESFHQLICDQINLLQQDEFFKIRDQSIVGINGSEFFFAGMKTNPRKVKSTEGIDICWVEEGEKFSEESWQILIPTIRKPGSEIWVGFNPDLKTDPTYKRFVLNPPPGARVVNVNWRDNPWISKESRDDKDYLASVDLDAYNHVWEGHCREFAEAQILKGKCVVEWFEPQPLWDGPYFGADWGFSSDPTALVKLWINGRLLMWEKEFYRIGLELDETAAAFKTVPGADKHVIRGDGSRPETISYLNRQGLNVVAARTGPGSVEDGIAFLRSFEKIIIHPDCPHTVEESRLYSYKTDRLSGDVLPVIVDAHNHCIDGGRYALEPVIRANSLFSENDWS